MPARYWNGESLVPEADLRRQLAGGGWRARAEAIGPDEGEATIALGADPLQFAPIGIGKPMSIRIHTVYVGDLQTGWWSKRADVLVVSGAKAAQIYESAPRAINLLQPSLRDHEFAQFNSFEPGTPIVYYTKAMTDNDVRVTLELIADSFKHETLTKVANLMQSAGGLPVFAPASTYLLAGAFVTRILGDLGKAFVESGPTLRDQLELTFGVGGRPDFREGFYVLADERTFAKLRDYRIKGVQDGEQHRVRLVHRDRDEEYRGDAPYIIVGVDGRNETALESFTPRHATAATLERFYSTTDSTAAAVTALEDALKLFNDLQYRTKAQDLEARLSQMDPSSDEYAELKELYDAYRKNIEQDEFQVPDLGDG